MFNIEKLEEDRQKFVTSEYRKGYLTFNDYTMPESFRYIQKEIEDFEVFDDDIWIATFPKCGTTWCQEMVWCITRDFDYKSTTEDTDIRMPFIEFCSLIHPPDNKPLPNDLDYLRNSIQFARNAARPRIIKTHLPFELLPKKIQTFERNPRVINVYRNIKDTCVSYYHHHRLFENYKGDFNLFWKLFLTGKLNYTPMIKNILSYWQHRQRPNFLFIKFEDMITNIRSVILTTCEFFNKSISENEIEELMDHLSFDSMQNNPHVDKNLLVAFCTSLGICVNNENFIREGTSGSYKTVMNQEIESIFDNYAKEKLLSTELTLI